MAKKMIINCGDCDARNVSEETLAAYESIVINTGTVFVTPESKNLLNRYGVTMNCGDTVEMDKDVQISAVNGSHQIRSTDVVTGKRYLNVNGSLTIGPDCQKVLESYVGISVNGSVTYPESMNAYLGNLSVNGSTTCYPDEAIVLKSSAFIDRLFALRAKSKLYWAKKRMIMVDPALDPAALAAKGATFSAETVILAQSKVEGLIDLIDEKANIVIVPDGTSVIVDDVVLDDMILRKNGAKLYIIGDLTVNKDSIASLGQLEYLNVRGDVTAVKEAKELLMEKLTDVEGKVKVSKGLYLNDKMSVRISKWMLEKEADGISVSDCMKVKIDPDIPRELILERLSVSDCKNVVCTPEQEDALAAVCEDVMQIGPKEDKEDGMGIGDIIKGALGGAKELLDTKIINAGDYVL